MLAIALFYAAVAAALGTRFKVLVIIPAAILVLVTTISFGIAARWGFHDVATTLLMYSCPSGRLRDQQFSQSLCIGGPFQAHDSLAPAISPLA